MNLYHQIYEVVKKIPKGKPGLHPEAFRGARGRTAMSRTKFAEGTG